MKTLVIFLATLSVVFAIPNVRTWSWVEIEYALNYPHGDIPTTPDLKKCLEYAFEKLLENLNEDELVSSFGAVIPAPSGEILWTISELTNALNIVAKQAKADIKTRLQNYDKHWTYDELEELHFITSLTEPDGIEESLAYEIIHCIIRTMCNIMLSKKKYRSDQASFPVILPAVDISRWSAIEAKHFLKDPNADPEVKTYLKRARNTQPYLFNKDETYCVVTPVELLPKEEPYTYLPDATIWLLSQARVTKDEWSDNESVHYRKSFRMQMLPSDWEHQPEEPQF